MILKANEYYFNKSIFYVNESIVNKLLAFTLWIENTAVVKCTMKKKMIVDRFYVVCNEIQNPKLERKKNCMKKKYFKFFINNLRFIRKNSYYDRKKK